ncbi:MAG TPA: nucleotidyltransferase domain-containing protein [Planctomycetota bacterium]|nr:nucleotidyltransferase domain-containing protein [Planctomycetota bacterium]
MVSGSQFHPHAILPVGTQVVLLKDLEVFVPPGSKPGKRTHKLAGSVGVVKESPVTNDYPYILEFADGERVVARRTELVVRRADTPIDELPAREFSAFEPYLVYRVRMGSQAFGLARDSSDVDERGVYVPPADWHWSLQPLPEQIEFKRLPDGRLVDHNSAEPAERDVCWWELEKFLRLALKANPNLLESLYVPDEHVLFADELGRKLRSLREAFLSKYIYHTYSGYVLSQFKKMKASHARGEGHRPKHAMHLVRLLFAGIEALRGNGILVDIGPHRDELLRIRDEGISFDEVYARALELEREFQDAYAHTTLPDRPDVTRVDGFLIEARRSRV